MRFNLTQIKLYSHILLAAIFFWSQLSLATPEINTFNYTSSRMPANATKSDAEKLAIAIADEAPIKNGASVTSEFFKNAYRVAKESSVTKAVGAQGKLIFSDIPKDLLYRGNKQLWQTNKMQAFNQSLVPQQMLFTAIMGTLTYADLNHHLQNNPEAMNFAMYDGWGAVGMAGFSVMMGINGYSNHLITEGFLKNSPKARIIMPTIGFGAGMFGMMHVSAILSNPSVKLCTQMITTPFEKMSSESLTLEQQKAEVAKKRAKLFEEYGLDPLSSPCDDAYEAMFGAKALLSTIPGVAGALMTQLLITTMNHTILSKLIVRYAGSAEKAAALKFRFTFSVTSSGSLRMASFLSGVSKLVGTTPFTLAAFIMLHERIDPYLSTAWKGYWDGWSLQSDGSQVESYIKAIRKQNWLLDQAQTQVPEAELDQSCLEKLKKQKENMALMNKEAEANKILDTAKCHKFNVKLNDLSQLLYSWRNEKLQYKVMNAHYAWQSFLQNYQSNEEAAYSLYKGLVFAANKDQQAKNEDDTLLKSGFATYGVRRIGEEKNTKDYLSNPTAYKKDQLDHIKKVIKHYREKWQPRLESSWGSATEKENIKNLISKLESDDYKVVTLGLNKLSEMYNQSIITRANPLSYGIFESVDYLWSEIGSPTPYPENGRGYMYLLSEVDDHRQAFITAEKVNSSWFKRNFFGFDPIKRYNNINQEKPTDFLEEKYVPEWARNGVTKFFTSIISDYSNSFFYKDFGKYKMPTVVDKFVVQMACGSKVEDKQKEPLSYWEPGYRATFRPPTIVKNPEFARKHICEGDDQLDVSKLYSDKIKGEDGKIYNGIIDYISNNLKDELKTDEGFDKWWKENVEPQSLETYKKFRIYYDSIVANMWQITFKPESKAFYSSEKFQHLFNFSQVGDNKVIGSMEQQFKFGLAIIQDIYLTGLKLKSTEYATDLSDKAAPADASQIANKYSVVLSSLRSSDNMMFDTFINSQNETAENTINPQKNFKFSEELLADFRKVMSFIEQTQVEIAQVNGKERQYIRAKYNYSDFEKQISNLYNKINKEIDSRLVTAEPKAEDKDKNQKAVLVTNPITQESLQLAKSLLTSLVYEMKSLGSTLALTSLKMGQGYKAEGQATVLSKSDKESTASDLSLLAHE